MKLMDELKRFNTTEVGTQFIDSNGRPFAQMPVGKGKASPTSPYEILRGDLADVLYRASKDNPNTKYVFNTFIEEVLCNDERCVKVQLSNGEVLAFDLAIAADGQWSNLRKLCFSPSDVTTVDKGMFIAYWTAPRQANDNNWWNLYHVPGSRVVMTRPDPYGTLRAAMDIMPCSAGQWNDWVLASRSDVETQKELVRKEFAGVGWETQRLLNTLDSAPDFYMQHIQQVKMFHWSKGRVVCLGDAAYAPTPITGMGTPLAIVGAYILAGEISKLEGGAHPSIAFEGFEKILRPHVEKVQALPSFIPGLVHPRTAWRIWILQSVISFAAWLARKPWIAGWLSTEGTDPELSDWPLPRCRSLDDLVERHWSGR